MLYEVQGRSSPGNINPYIDFESNNRVASKPNFKTSFEKEVERRLGMVGRLKQRVVQIRSSVKNPEDGVNYSEKRYMYSEIDKQERRLEELEKETHEAADRDYFGRTND